MSLRHALTRTALIGGVLALAACGGGDTSESEDVPLTPEEERALFLGTLIEADAIPNPPTPDIENSAVGLGDAICTLFDEGATFEVVANDLLAAGNSDPGTWIGASVGGFCPEHLDEIPD
jgi:hypothetical protein